jgi:hypothetical protein
VPAATFAAFVECVGFGCAGDNAAPSLRVRGLYRLLPGFGRDSGFVFRPVMGTISSKRRGLGRGPDIAELLHFQTSAAEVETL